MDLFGADRKSLGNPVMRTPLIEKVFDLLYIVRHQFLEKEISGPRGVAHVLSMATEVEMIWADTGRVVATM